MAEHNPNEEIWAQHPSSAQPKRMLRKKYDLLHGADANWEVVDAPEVAVSTGIVAHPDLPQRGTAPAPGDGQTAAAPAPSTGTAKNDSKESAR